MESLRTVGDDDFSYVASGVECFAFFRNPERLVICGEELLESRFLNHNYTATSVPLLRGGIVGSAAFVTFFGLLYFGSVPGMGSIVISCGVVRVEAKVPTLVLKTQDSSEQRFSVSSRSSYL